MAVLYNLYTISGETFIYMQIKDSFKQIHLVPFDLGAVLYDKLSVDNTKNLDFIDNFCNELEKSLKPDGMELKRCYKVKHINKGNFTIEFSSDELAEQALCEIKITEDVYCYILSMGIGVFVIADLCNKAVEFSKEDKKYDVALLSYYQKKITQSELLFETEANASLKELNDKMLKVRNDCWRLVKMGEKSKKIKIVRPFSSNADYKYKGLSYVLTIYLFEKKTAGGAKESDDFSTRLKNLLYSPIFSDIKNKEKWKDIEKNLRAEFFDEEYSIKTSQADIYFSWSAVAYVGKSAINSFSDIKSEKVLSTLVRSENFVQSRWAVADNSMDNVNKQNKYDIEGMQRLSGIVEIYQADINNAISANMQTLHKNILQKVIDTSNVKYLYKSVLQQIDTQIKIKEAHYRDKNIKNRLAVDLLLAIFTAASLYKTLIDIIYQNFKWYNIVFFIVTLFIAVGGVLMNYKKR